MAGFKDFVVRGNVVDLAVGVIIGAAFGGIVDSMTKDVITPIIGMIGGQPDFSAIKAGPIGLGSFANAIISFVIKAGVVYFLIVKPFTTLMARLNPAPPAAPARACPFCISNIPLKATRCPHCTSELKGAVA
jgi:large conductance mechanosensitive channel